MGGSAGWLASLTLGGGMDSPGAPVSWAWQRRVGGVGLSCTRGGGRGNGWEGAARSPKVKHERLGKQAASTDNSSGQSRRGSSQEHQERRVIVPPNSQVAGSHPTIREVEEARRRCCFLS